MLSKVNNDARAAVARANAYITGPTATGYTIQADVIGTRGRAGKLPDMGVVANRYTLVLDGKTDPRPASGRSGSCRGRPAPRVNVAVAVRLEDGHVVHRSS